MTKEYKLRTPIFPTEQECSREIEWRERVQMSLPTDANQRRINYLRERLVFLGRKRRMI